ncbi:ATP-binding protein [Emticicia oligotrophica]|uniref:ATP-binding protein n=1 Tax=Emticicia oligotrophica TaxID=312279 RepID=UPI00273C5ECB|nr:ATP-binding protein [Emticicia oligotrophica]
MSNINSVSIKIQTGVYGQFRNLNNKVWFALGEYVDNAVQSYENNQEKLKTINKNYQFEVRITIDWEGDFIVIYDNAAGIDSNNFQRAFEPANIPIDDTGLNEFGMGMKTASIWLADRWSVRTAALDESEERFVEFDLKKVLAEKSEILNVKSSEKERTHFTEIALYQLSKNAPRTHQMDKIKKHLASIYRKFIRKGDMKLFINDEELLYDEPEILKAPFYTNTNGNPIEWKKQISFSTGKYSVNGFIAILNTMSTSEVNGLSLFRRGRVIEGSHDEKYRPKAICGQTGSPRYKRIFGELELDGFAVSFNKGSFQEQDDLEVLMEAIQTEISAKDFDLYNQAEKYIKPRTADDNIKVAKNIVSALKKSSNQINLKQGIELSLIEIENENITIQNDILNRTVETIDSHEDIIDIKGEKYKLKLELITEKEVPELYSIVKDDDELFTQKVTYTINLAHPFFTRYEKLKNEEDYQPIISIIRSLVLAEIIAPSQGTKYAGNIRTNFNHFLRNI